MGIEPESAIVDLSKPFTLDDNDLGTWEFDVKGVDPKTGAVCTSAPPTCPVDTVPGVTNGCWSGYCIPKAACPVPACETLTDENVCVSRADCWPVYDGAGCTCTPGGACTCQSESFARCESGYIGPPPLGL